MLEKMKNTGWMLAGILFMVLSVVALLFLVRGGVWLTATHTDLIATINGWIFCLVLLLLFLSIFPRIRLYTGLGIYYCSSIWLALFWFFCLYITYEFWGFVGVLIGLFFAGVGIFATGIIAIFHDGQTSGALFMLLNLLMIWGIRMLGYWIATKHKEKPIKDASVLAEETQI